MSQDTLGQSDCRVFKSAICLEQNDGMAGFFHDDTNSWILKVD